MKFVAILIRLLSALLLFSLFGAFLYYTFIAPTTSPRTAMNLGNLALFLFVLAAIIFSLFSVGLENIIGKKNDNAVIKTMMEKLNNVNAGANSETNNVLNGKISLLLDQLNAADNSKIINLGLQQVNERIDKLQEITTAKNEKITDSFNNIDVLTAQITAAINSVKESMIPPEQDYSPVMERINLIEENFNNTSDSTMKFLTKLQGTVSDLSDKSANLEHLFQQVSVLVEAVSNINKRSEDMREKIELMNLQQDNMADQINKLLNTDYVYVDENENDEVKDNVSTDDIMNTIQKEPVIEEPAPIATEEPVIEEPAPIATKEPIIEESAPIATEESVIEEPTPIVTEEQDSGEYTIKADNPFGVQVSNDEIADTPEIAGIVNPAEYSSESPFGTEHENTTADLPDLPTDINPNELSSDEPFGKETYNRNHDELNTESTDISADNPYGEPVDLSAPSDLDNINPNKILKDGATEDVMQQNLNKIFNDQLASDLASLDIMQDENNTANNYDEIDLNALLGDEASQ